jgi:hypothetical protein
MSLHDQVYLGSEYFRVIDAWNADEDFWASAYGRQLGRGQAAAVRDTISKIEVLVSDPIRCS